MRVLVTGGAGYIGSIVADALLAQEHEVTILDNLTRGRLQHVPEAAHFVLGDVGDEPTLDEVLRTGQFGAVMHFAALIEAGESMVSPELYFVNNSGKALTLLRMVLKHRVPRFVFSSSAAVYGNPRNIPISEDDPTEPINVYGESKLFVERMLKWFHKVHGLRYAILRYFNAAGAVGNRGEAHQPETHLIPLVLEAALGKKDAIFVYGTDYPTRDGTCIRDYIHVADLAAAHVLALAKLAEQPEIICNLGSEHGFSVREVIEIVHMITGTNIKALEMSRRPGDAAVLIASSDKARQLLGWRPQQSDIRNMIRSAWEWQSKVRNGS